MGGAGLAGKALLRSTVDSLGVLSSSSGAECCLSALQCSVNPRLLYLGIYCSVNKKTQASSFDVGCLWILRLKPKQRFTSNAFPFPSIQPNSSPHSHAPSSSAAAMSGQAALKNMSFNVRYTALVFVVQSLARAAMHEAA